MKKTAIFKSDGNLSHIVEANYVLDSGIDVSSLEYEFNFFDGVNVIWKDTIKTFSELQTAKIKQLHDNYSEFYKNYTNSYSTLEVESFKDKADEAKAYMRDNTSPTPYVDAMVGGDDALRVELLNAIWAKVSYLASVEGQLVVKRDAIKATTTQEELDAIDITFGA